MLTINGDPPSLELALLDPSGATLATATSGSSNVDWEITNAQVSGSGTHYARVTGDAGREYSLIALNGAVLALEPNDATSTAQNIGSNGIAVGNARSGSSTDYYRFGVNGGDTLIIDVATPGSGTGEPINDLEPEITLFDVTGAHVLSDTGAPTAITRTWFMPH